VDVPTRTELKATMAKRQSAGPTVRQRISALWHRTDRARALAQVPIVALGPGAGPVADQVRLAPPPDPAAIRRDTDLDLQKQWAHYELQRREAGTGYQVREDPGERKSAGTRAPRDRPDHEHGR
jgi:hypothetical protein